MDRWARVQALEHSEVKLIEISEVNFGWSQLYGMRFVFNREAEFGLEVGEIENRTPSVNAFPMANMFGKGQVRGGDVDCGEWSFVPWYRERAALCLSKQYRCPRVDSECTQNTHSGNAVSIHRRTGALTKVMLIHSARITKRRRRKTVQRGRIGLFLCGRNWSTYPREKNDAYIKPETM
jgi:hypothetical protein